MVVTKERLLSQVKKRCIPLPYPSCFVPDGYFVLANAVVPVLYSCHTVIVGISLFLCLQIVYFPKLENHLYRQMIYD